MYKIHRSTLFPMPGSYQSLSDPGEDAELALQISNLPGEDAEESSSKLGDDASLLMYK